MQRKTAQNVIINFKNESVLYVLKRVNCSLNIYSKAICTVQKIQNMWSTCKQKQCPTCLVPCVVPGRSVWPQALAGPLTAA